MAETDKEPKEDLSADDDGSTNDSESESDPTESSDSDSDYECTVCRKRFSGALPLRQHLKGSKHKKTLSRRKKERKLLDRDADEEEDEDHILPEPYRTCKACDKEFSGLEPYQMHLKSKLHRQKVLQAVILEKVKEGGEINVDKLRDLYLHKKGASGKSDVPDCSRKAHGDGQDEPDKVEYECKDCDKTFCGLVPFGQHLASKTHAKQVEKRGLLAKVTSENVDERGKTPESDVSSLVVEDDILVCKICSTSFSGPENAMAHLKSRKHRKKLDKHWRKLEKKMKKAAALKQSGSDLSEGEDNEAAEGKDQLDANVSKKI